MRSDEHSLTGRTTPSRRHYPRVKTPEGVSVYWGSGGLEDTSPVRDLRVGGLFLETSEARPLGTTVRLEFLVQEGAIRVEAIVRYVSPGSGMGLKFTSVQREDAPRLTALVSRFGQLHQ
jgi:hypothetical protein